MFKYAYQLNECISLGMQAKKYSVLMMFFLYARLKHGNTYDGRAGGRACGWAASTGYPLSKSKSFHQVFIKLGEYVGVHNVTTKFYNQQNPPCTPELWPLNCPKLGFSLYVKEFSSDLYQTW